MKILGKRAMVLIENSQQTESGFILPYSEDNLGYLKGKILKLGEEYKNLKISATIMFTKIDFRLISIVVPMGLPSTSVVSSCFTVLSILVGSGMSSLWENLLLNAMSSWEML